MARSIKRIQKELQEAQQQIDAAKDLITEANEKISVLTDELRYLSHVLHVPNNDTLHSPSDDASDLSHITQHSDGFNLAGWIMVTNNVVDSNGVGKGTIGEITKISSQYITFETYSGKCSRRTRKFLLILDEDRPEVGSRIVVTNQRKDSKGVGIATIGVATRIKADFVYFETENGVKTKRLLTNVHKLMH